jgi:hypothetical protein
VTTLLDYSIMTKRKSSRVCSKSLLDVGSHFFTMGHIIKIHKRGQEIDLEIRKYKIDVLGGWGVKLGQFSILFRHEQSGQTINPKRSFWPIQTYAFDNRAKRIFLVDIVQPGTYTVEFKNAETLQVKETNLFFPGLFEDPIPNDKISIFIH